MSRLERRLYTRVESHIPVTLIYNDCPIANRYTKNISIGGVYISAPDLGLSTDSLLTLQINFDFNRGSFRIPAIVCRLEDNGMAAYFETIDKATELYISLALKNKSQCLAT